MALLSYIANGDDDQVAENKVLSVIGMELGYDDIPTSGIVGDARTKLNQIAVAKGLPSIQLLDLGLSARTKLNALMDAVGLQADYTWYYDAIKGIVISSQPYNPADILACTRASGGYAFNSSGAWVPFGNNTLRITDLGLLIEPAATDIVAYPVEGSSWINAMTTSADDPAGPYLGVFTDPQIVTSTSTSLNARVRSSTSASNVEMDLTYALTYWVKAGTTNLVSLFGTVSAGTSRLIVDLANNYNVISSTNSRGTMTLVSGRLVAQGVHEIKVLWVPNATEGADLGAGPGSGVAGENVGVVGFRLEAGSVHYSPSGPGGGSSVLRAADSITFPLPAGTHDLTFTFDDDSTQIIAGQSVEYTIPTNLNRRVIKRITATAA